LSQSNLSFKAFKVNAAKQKAHVRLIGDGLVLYQVE